MNNNSIVFLYVCAHFFRSSDDEDDDDSDEGASPKKQRKEDKDDDIGKVIICEITEKRKNTWFPGLVSFKSFGKPWSVQSSSIIGRHQATLV